MSESTFVVYLIGQPGVGKYSIASELSKKYKVKFNYYQPELIW